MKKKNLLLLGSALLLAACGGQRAASSQPAPASSEPAPASSEAPVASSETPVASSEAPAASSEAPVASSEAPVASSEAPVASSEAPAVSSEAPVISSESAPGSSEPASEESVPGLSSDYVVPDNVEISFWTTGSQGMNETLTALAETFEEAVKDATGKTVTVDIAVQGGYDEIETKVLNGLPTGVLPNIAVAYPDTVANIIHNEAGGKQYLYDIEPYMDDPNIGFGTQDFLGDTEEADKYDIVESFLEEGHKYAREGYYSYPFMKSSEVMFYYQDYVEAAYKYYKPAIKGRENIAKDLTNMTWSEFEQLLDVVMKHKADINDQLEVGCFYDNDSNWFITQMYQKDIPYSSIVDGKGHIDFKEGDDRTRAEDMLTSLKALADDKRMTTGGIEGVYGSDFFKTERTLFSIGSSGGTGYQMPEGLDPEDIGVVPIPRAGDLAHVGYVSQGPTLCFLKNPTVSDEINDAQMYYSWMFAKYLTNTANNVEICITGSQGYIPIRYSSYENEDFIEYLSGSTLYAKSGTVLIQDIMGNYLNTAVFPGSAQLRDEVGAALTCVLTGEKSVTQALADAINNAESFIQN